MHSHATERFWRCFEILPKEVQKRAKRAFKIWSENPNHPSLHFKQIHKTESIFSVRIGLHHRAVGVKKSTTVIWFWIGTHEEYNNLITQL